MRCPAWCGTATAASLPARPSSFDPAPAPIARASAGPTAGSASRTRSRVKSCSSSGPAALPRSGRPLAVRGRAGATSRSCCLPPPSSKRLPSPPTRGEQRHGRHSGERERPRPRRDSDAPRPSSPTTCCGRCRRSACSAARAACRRIRRRRACRCGASARAASAARSCCSTACRSTIRSAAGCTGRGCPSSGVHRIEIVDGSSSSLYGNYAMGGVINIVTARRRAATLDVRTQYGNRTSPKFDVAAQRRVGQSRRVGRTQASSAPTAFRSSST